MKITSLQGMSEEAAKEEALLNSVVEAKTQKIPDDIVRLVEEMENGLLEEEDADYQEPEHPDKGLAINVELFDELAAVGEEAEDTVEEEIVEEEIVDSGGQPGSQQHVSLARLFRQVGHPQLAVSGIQAETAPDVRHGILHLPHGERPFPVQREG